MIKQVVFMVILSMVFVSFMFSFIVYADVFDRAEFGVEASLSSGGGGGGDVFDSIYFGVEADFTSGSGSSDWSSVWELYHLGYDRCDYDVSGVVNIFDTSECYISMGSSDYLYDCDSFPVGDGVVNIFDVSRTYIRQGVT